LAGKEILNLFNGYAEAFKLVVYSLEPETKMEIPVSANGNLGRKIEAFGVAPPCREHPVPT
jgi:hypothetical protein